MANPTPRKFSSRLIEFALILALAYVLTDTVGKWFFPSEDQKPPVSGIVLSMADATVRAGNHPSVVVENHTAVPFTLPDTCPQPPFTVSSVDGEKQVPLTAAAMATACPLPLTIAPGEKATLSLQAWKYSLFAANGTYELRLKD